MPDFKFHDLRKTFGSVLAQNGISTVVIQRLLEHSSQDLTNKVYTNVDPVLCQAIDTMPAGDGLRVRIVGKGVRSNASCQLAPKILSAHSPDVFLLDLSNAVVRSGLWTVGIWTVGHLPVSNQYVEVVSRDTILVLTL